MRLQCDQLRKVIEQIRKHEREILAFCIDKARIPHAQFLKGNCITQESSRGPQLGTGFQRPRMAKKTNCADFQKNNNFLSP